MGADALDTPPRTPRDAALDFAVKALQEICASSYVGSVPYRKAFFCLSRIKAIYPEAIR